MNRKKEEKQNNQLKMRHQTKKNNRNYDQKTTKKRERKANEFSWRQSTERERNSMNLVKAHKKRRNERNCKHKVDYTKIGMQSQWICKLQTPASIECEHTSCAVMKKIVCVYVAFSRQHPEKHRNTHKEKESESMAFFLWENTFPWIYHSHLILPHKLKP